MQAVGIQGYTREYRAIPNRRYRIDIAFPEKKIAVEVMGGTWNNGRHNRGAGYETDCEKASLLAGLGWRYVPVTTDQVRKGLALGWIEQALRVKA
jgi:very-short-patch-repair endonuclease